MTSESDRPAISIVTATYNRSRVLACAIESVRRQTFTGWEMVIVGDACTDETATLVAGLDDPRIRFINLSHNFGEQAGPNNIGVAESRAPLVAFLNHDDLWFPNHLALCREVLIGEAADIVFGASVFVAPESPVPLRFDALWTGLRGLGERGRYSPATVEGSAIPASSWLMRREVLTRIRGWRLGRDCHSDPSQDLLFRAWRAGFRMRPVKAVTVVMVTSGHRPASYLEGGASEQEWILDRLDDPAFASELAASAYETNARFNARTRGRAWRALRLLGGISSRLGINPRSVHFRLRKGFSRGEYIRFLRSVRGLPAPKAPPGEGPALRFELVRRSCRVDLPADLDFTAGSGGARFLASGWSRPESNGVWNDGPDAELMFDLDVPPTGAVVLHLEARLLLGPGEPGTVEVSAGGKQLETWKLGPSEEWHGSLLIPRSAAANALIVIGFRFTRTASPRSLGLSGDPRELAMCLVRGRIEAAGEGA